MRGLGAAMLQDGRPVAFASKALTGAECRKLLLLDRVSIYVLSLFIIHNRMHTIATNCENSLVIHHRLQTTDCLTKRSCVSQTKALTASLRNHPEVPELIHRTSAERRRTEQAIFRQWNHPSLNSSILHWTTADGTLQHNTPLQTTDYNE